MRSRLLSLAPLVLALFAILIPSGHAATVQSRITSAVNGSRRVPVQHTIPPRALRANDLGPASANTSLTSLSLRFNMTAAQEADITQLSADQQNPNSPHYHEWLTPEQYGARFGLSSSDLAKVSSWLTSQGFTITGTARSSNFITFTGTVAQAQQAFGTSIHSLLLDGEQHISNVTDPVLPSAIAGVVTTITGLNDFKLKPRARTVKLDPKYTSTVSGTTSHYMAPGDFYTIYNLNPLLSNSINGKGVTIGVLGQTSLATGNTDLNAFRTASGLSAYCVQTSVTSTTCANQNLPILTLQLYGSNPGVVPGDIDESNLDVEWSGAVAPSANILFIYSGDVLNTSLANAVSNNLAPILSISYGLCESNLGASQLKSYNQTLQQANVQGITIVSAAGDSGATDCDTAGLATEGLAVDFPSSSPFVTSAGGTQFSGDVSNSSAYWTSSNGTNGGSATGYIPEVPWNETTSASGLGDATGGGGGAGGGGASAFFAKPAWQVGTGVPADGARDVPDFSLNSGAQHDGYIVCTQSLCSNGFASTNGNLANHVYGGTSVAAPTFAGILALVTQKQGGGRLGNIGPVLYSLPNFANVYNDITTGNNSVPCFQGTPNCTTGAPIGFNAGVGYDQATGLGSINGANFVNNWSAAAAAPTGVLNNAAILSTTTLTTSAVTCGITTSIPFTVSVAAASSSAVTPTGTVQFYVDTTPVGGPVALSGGSATYTLSTTGLSSGSHNVSAVYSGDATFAASRGALLTNASNTGIVTQIDVVSSSSPDFSFTPCTASAAVATGGTASPVVLTVTPFNGFTGAVNFAVHSDTGDVFNTNFSVKPVNITTTSGVTTSFVLIATENTASLTPAHVRPGSSQRPTGRTPWYAAGSGATLACLVLLIAPRRRRWGALLVVLLSVAAMSFSGCGSSSSTTGGGGGGGGGGGTGATPAPRGTYNLTITATSGSLVHSSVLTYTVQ